MAPETRSAQMSLSQVADMEFLKNAIVSLQDSMDKKLDSLTSRIEKMELSQNPNSQDKHTPDSSSSGDKQVAYKKLLKGIKLEVPKFLGEDMLG